MVASGAHARLGGHVKTCGSTPYAENVCCTVAIRVKRGHPGSGMAASMSSHHRHPASQILWALRKRSSMCTSPSASNGPHVLDANASSVIGLKQCAKAHEGEEHMCGKDTVYKLEQRNEVCPWCHAICPPLEGRLDEFYHGVGQALVPVHRYAVQRAAKEARRS